MEQIEWPQIAFAQAKDVLSTQVEETTVLMSMETGRFMELNETAGAVWELTDGAAKVSHIVHTLSHRFDVSPETCKADVVELYTELESEGFVARVD